MNNNKNNNDNRWNIMKLINRFHKFSIFKFSILLYAVIYEIHHEINNFICRISQLFLTDILV